MSIYKKLMNIQEELKAPKGQYNSFGKYKYRSCEDILEAVKPILVKNNCTLVIADTLENIGDRYYIKATVKVIDIETGETVENTAYAREEESRKGMNGDQLTGACSSYARKYALNGMFCIDDTKDSDTGKPDNSKDKYPPQEDKVEPDNSDRGKAIRVILKLIEGNDELLEKQLKMQGLKCLNDANENQLRIIYKNLQMELKK